MCISRYQGARKNQSVAARTYTVPEPQESHFLSSRLYPLGYLVPIQSLKLLRCDIYFYSFNLLVGKLRSMAMHANAIGPVAKRTRQMTLAAFYGLGLALLSILLSLTFKPRTCPPLLRTLIFARCSRCSEMNDDQQLQTEPS